MLIIGAKGFAKEVLEILFQQKKDEEGICFFDNLSADLPELLYNKFKIRRTFEDVETNKYQCKEFVLGIGGTKLREKLYTQFCELGLVPYTLISPYAHIGHYNNQIGMGSTIMTGAVLTNDICIGKGTLINLNATIGHDTNIGHFCDIMPGTNISGGVTIGNYCNIGTGSVILPKVRIGDSVTVGAGAVVNKDVPDNTTVVGIPAKAILR